MAPVMWLRRARYTASWRGGSASRGAISGMSWNSVISMLVPNARRPASAAMPMGRLKLRKWVLMALPSGRSSTSLPAW